MAATTTNQLTPYNDSCCTQTTPQTKSLALLISTRAHGEAQVVVDVVELTVRPRLLQLLPRRPLRRLRLRPEERREGGLQLQAARAAAAAAAVAGGPVAVAGGFRRAGVHGGRAPGGDAGLLDEQLRRRGRVRARVQGPRRREDQARPPAAAGRRRQAARPRGLAGTQTLLEKRTFVRGR